MRRRTRNLAAAAVTATAMATVLIGTVQSSVPFVSPGQLDDDLDGRRVQVEGVVTYVDARDDHLRLELSDGDAAEVAVTYSYREHRPLTLEAGRIVVAKGEYSDGLVTATQVSVRAHEE